MGLKKAEEVKEDLTCLVEIEIVVKRDDLPQSRRPQPCQSVAADGEEDERHIQLQCLSCTFRHAETIAHDPP